MRIYLVAHSFVMISVVFAAKVQPVRIVQRQTTSPANTVTPILSIPTTTSSNSVVTSPTGVVTSATSQTTASTAVSSLTSAITSPLSATSTTSTTSANSITSSAVPSDTSVSETAASTVTDPEGQVSTVFVTASSSGSSVLPTSTPSNSNTGDSDTGIHPGTIIGLSVAGGIAAIAIIGFIIWKLTRKRFTDLDDPNEAIKWPELNREHVGGSSTDGLSREVSNFSSGALSRDMTSEHSDPYAVPPLPQFNPNQPYRDDPYAASNAGYYDPYRGPVPQTLHDDSMEGHENIPMNAYPSSTRTRSPGPAMSLDMGGRGSPGPGRMSPGPGLAYNVGDRASPAPGRTMSPAVPASGMDRRASPGPQYALGGQP